MVVGGLVVRPQVLFLVLVVFPVALSAGLGRHLVLVGCLWLQVYREGRASRGSLVEEARLVVPVSVGGLA